MAPIKAGVQAADALLGRMAALADLHNAEAFLFATLPANARTAISLHVHDEICLDVPRGSYPRERFIEKLIGRPSWAPDLPIAVDVWINPRYGKR